MRKHPLAKCEECPLYETGRYVPSAGPSSAKLAFVGEAPGVQEVHKGRPFVGPSGQLLDRVARHHGIRLDDTVLTNATLCRPLGNATPPKMAVEACRGRLEQELADAGVDTVIALGNTASESLLRLSKVTQLRVGPGRPARYDPDVRVISTIHPAACLRQGDMFPHLVQDVGKAVVKSADWTEPRYFVVSDRLEALSVIESLRGRVRVLAVDIEVDVEKDLSFSHPNQYGMLCVGIAYSRDQAVIFPGSVLDAEVYSHLAALLREVELIAQNGKFDLEGLYPHLGRILLHFDVMLASYACDERSGIHSLDYQSREYLGAPDWKGAIKPYVTAKGGYGSIPKNILYKYNAFDAVNTFRLRDYYLEKFKRPAYRDARRVHDFLVDKSNAFVPIELNGLAIDREYLRKLEGEYLDSLGELELQLNGILQRGQSPEKDEWIIACNPRSPIQLKKVFAQYRVKVASTDKDTLELIQEKTHQRKGFEDVHEFVTTLQRYRREAKLYGTYVKGTRLRLYRGRVHPTFLLHGTTTGRTSCRNPNVQNIPRESSIRRLFVPAKPERVYIQVDYSQAELRVLSYLAGDKYFRDVFNSGHRDLFDELTAVLYPDADRALLSGAQWKELRIRVKAYVYGLSYGRTEYSIASEYNITEAEARQGMNAFFGVIPEIVAFREQTRQKVLRGEDLINPFGRHRRFPLLTKENVDTLMKEALAFLPQSTASDMCLQALSWVQRDLKGWGWIRNMIHDALLVECHKEDAEEIAAMVSKHMIDSAKTIVGDYVLFATDYKIGPSWGDV